MLLTQQQQHQPQQLLIQEPLTCSSSANVSRTGSKQVVTIAQPTNGCYVSQPFPGWSQATPARVTMQRLQGRVCC
jgi:hypothetical protein